MTEYALVLRSDVNEIWEPDAPENAIAGMPSRAASVVAPTVPDIRVVEPAFTSTVNHL